MAQKPFKLNRLGVRQLLRSTQTETMLHRLADRTAAAAGPGHRVESEIGKNRARAVVITDSWPARWAEARRRNLTKALGSTRL